MKTVTSSRDSALLPYLAGVHSFPEVTNKILTDPDRFFELAIERASSVDGKMSLAQTTTLPPKDSIRARCTQKALSAQQSWLYHLRSIWLFTKSDLKTIIIPKTIFGVLNAIAAPLYGIHTGVPLKPYAILLAAFWVWINLLPFVIDNQRRPESIKEDRQNKPWRTMPSGRMTEKQARAVMFTLYPLAFLLSVIIGGWRSSLALMAFGFWYNDLGGAGGVFTKNFINACGFCCFAFGAMEVALAVPLPLSPRLVNWILVIAATVFTTVQTQDLPDQEGDRLCGRKTVPLAIGDYKTRIATAFFMVIWSLFCPFYWHTPAPLFFIFASLGVLIGGRSLFKRDVRDDEITFKLWNGWMALLYALPFLTYISQRAYAPL
jgi:4-hydroxybenzoate polyprenyltransferase